ncbi:MAG: tol-pal system YbgF family protein [Bdellovibrionales bacterium]
MLTPWLLRMGFIVVLMSPLFSFSSHAQTVRVLYSRSEWNKSPLRIDSIAILIRDQKNGKIVQMLLNESTIDSGHFTGTYRVQWDEKNLEPEVYIPKNNTGQLDKPQGSLTADHSAEALIRSQKVARTPYVMRKDENGERVLEIFNTREEASQALQNYKAALKAKPKADETVTESLLETAEKAKQSEELVKNTKEAMVRESERKKLLDEQKKRRQEMVLAMGKMPAAEQARRKKVSAGLLNQGMESYHANVYDKANTLLKQSYDLDPTNTDVIFTHGVVQYKLDKNNESLVSLDLANDGKGKFNKNERDFYKALNYYKLNENAHALKTLKNLKSLKDPAISPTSAFYEGLVLFKEAKYDEAKNSFQEVLDTSSDPALDQKAEEYMEQIDKAKAYAKNSEKKWFLGMTAGMQYDSNVLLVNSSSPSSSDPSQVADYRYLTGFSAEHRALYSKEYELSIKGRADLMYSTKAENVAADPLAYSLKVPYKYKGMLFQKGFTVTATPGYEVLNLDENRSGANKDYISTIPEKDLYLTSYTGDLATMFVMTQDWFTGLTLKLRSDYSSSKAATGDNDPTAFKYTLTYNNMLFLNTKKNQAVLADIGFTDNRSLGKNLTYNKYDLAATYMHPLFYDIQGIFQLAMYQSNYPDKSGGRTDTNTTMLLNFSKPLLEWLSLSFGGNYINNQSTLTANTYNKYTITTTLSANYSF